MGGSDLAARVEDAALPLPEPALYYSVVLVLVPPRAPGGRSRRSELALSAARRQYSPVRTYVRTPAGTQIALATVALGSHVLASLFLSN